MRAQDVIRIARDRAGLTQQQLAARSGRPRETIVRWEAGSQEPSLEAVSDVVTACELDLVLRLSKRDTSLADRVREQLSLIPLERLPRLLPASAADEAQRSLRWLAGAQTQVVVVGQLGAALLGAPQSPDGPQVELVASDPVAIERELRTAGHQPLDAEDRWLDSDAREPWSLRTGGTLALARDIPGTGGFRDLRRNAVAIEVEGASTILVAHPRDLLRIADASPRESERSRVPGLQALLEVSSTSLAKDQLQLLRALTRNGVEFVVVGGVAAQLRGWAGATADLDIAVAGGEDNANRINRALAEVGLLRADVGGLGTSFQTQHGRLEIVRRADGVGQYDDWRRGASEMELEHLTIAVASPEDIVRSKEASGREKDLAALPSMREDLGLNS